LRATAACASTRTEYFRNAAEVPPPDGQAGAGAVHGRANGAASADRASLLLSSLLEKGEEIRIVFPLNGQVFYLDETLRTGAQAIPVSIAARDTAGVRVTVDGRREAPPGDLSGIRVPITRGTHSVVAQGPHGRDRVRFEVR
jgi:hypothetical protein